MSGIVREEFDQEGWSVYPDKHAHVYAYDANGRLSTDTITDGTNTWVKTYSYDANGRLSGESVWIKQ